MKKIFLFIAIGFLTACSLDIKSQDEISGDNIINTPTKAMGVLSQAYKSLPLSSEKFTLLTEDLQPNYQVVYKKNYQLSYNWDQRELTKTTATIWEDYYNALINLNVILLSNDNLNKDNKDWQYIKGNALLLKAYIYFDLLQLYTDRYNPNALGIIPKNSLSLETNKRLTQTETLVEINNLLEEGLSLIKDYPYEKSYFITEKGALHIQAQVALFMRDFSKAEKLAKDLLNDNFKLINTETTYANLWNNQLTSISSNVYWIYDLQENPNHYLYYQQNAGDYFYINEALSFAEKDIRHNVSQYLFKFKATGTDGIDRQLLGKYKTTSEDKTQKPIVMSRNTETYFILIESLIEQNKNAEAIQLLNDFLSNLNVDTLTPNLSQSELRAIFRLQKQKEFIGEKINFFDLKRWNIDLVRYIPDSNNKAATIKSTDFRWTWPLPASETRHNPNATQNEGWTIVD